jgi:acetyl-CoA carboxylase carboxyltransferase component
MVISDKAENSRFAVSAAKLASAYSAASVPKITLNIGKAYGTAYMIMGSKGLGADIVMAYPTAQISVLAPDTAVELIYGDKIMAAANPAEERATLVEEWEIKTASPVEASSSGQIDSIIEPEQTRQLIASAVLMLQMKRE